MKAFLSLIIIQLFSMLCLASVDLSGLWRFAVDREDKETPPTTMPQTILLPGSMASNNLGDKVGTRTAWTGQIVDHSWYKSDIYAPYRQEGNIKIPFWLQPVTHYKGVAWYSRTLHIDEKLAGKSLELYLERVHIESTLYLNGKKMGSIDSLGTPHRYLIPPLAQGEHRMDIKVDNRIKHIDFGQNAHSVSDHTQSNWNGIVGEISLKALPDISLAQVELYPDVDQKIVKARITVNNRLAQSKELHLHLSAASRYAPQQHRVRALSTKLSIPHGTSRHEIIYPMGDSFYQWDEFTPYVYQMNVRLGSDAKSYDFGMRKLEARGRRFYVNDKEIFLRGTLECAVFPKTGYPAMDEAEWYRILNICKNHGLNHMRFHSWCPPKAAFLAADRLGIYLQVEGGGWTTVGNGQGFDRWIYEETDRIFAEYGNHPSLMLYCYGNEPNGGNMAPFLAQLVKYCKESNPRHLYTSAAGWPMTEENQFRNEAAPRLKPWGAMSVLNTAAPRYDYQFDALIEQTKIPYISHEIGQWCVYPDLKEIERYRDCVLQAKNFEIFRDSLRKNGLAQHAENFLHASGKLQALLYKTEIEAALRTKNFAGYQLLGLNDFPGQGTALVGVLNPFWEEKGYISAREYAQFSSAVVPLIRTGEAIYTNNQSLDIPVEVAQFSAQKIEGVRPKWSLHFADGTLFASGNLARQDIPRGNCISLGKISCPLRAIKKAAMLTLRIELGDKGSNRWDFWVYPERVSTDAEDIHIATAIDEQMLAHLEGGGKVLLMGTEEKAKKGDVQLGFSSIFWNSAWTNSKQPPLTLGIYCDPRHPALRDFPTQNHSNYQWYEFCTNAAAVNLTKLNAPIEPIVRVIDDWFSNRSLGLIFEARVGRGKLLYCGKNLIHSEKAEVKQMLHSLLNYMKVDFNPQGELSIEQLKSL